MLASMGQNPMPRQTISQATIPAMGRYIVARKR
jgi:hypothetical protein